MNLFILLKLSGVCNKIWEITDSMWFLRNEKEHNKSNNEINITRNNEINEKTDRIFNRIPPMSLLPLTDRTFFKYQSEWIKKN